MFKIITTKTIEEVLHTEVEYTFEDGSSKTVTIAHYMPENKNDVISNIENRYLTEKSKKEAFERNLIIKEELENQD